MTTEPIFSAIAQRYDLCNHLFSFGLDFYWRKKAAKLCCGQPVENALDLCCGTGDMAFALVDTGRVKTITACDISLPMLECAKCKYEQWKQSHSIRCHAHTCVGMLHSVPIEWLHKPAEDTNLPDALFDLITCAFGLRNVNDVAQTLHEMHRLLKPGGKVCILEFFLPQNKPLRSVYLFYLCRVMPLAARWIAGNPGPWHYLARSIEQWEKINLPELLRNAGFQDIIIRPITFSTVQITAAQKTP
jgi:demethylmenaquinone methyltransferase/2-methoxy-6-polyprenyl-1,4-benzoquinol methylase